MTALPLLACAISRGVTVWADGEHLCLRGPRDVVAEVRQHFAACKPELLALLKDSRAAVVKSAWAAAFLRLSGLYADNLTGRLWLTTSRCRPTLARAIDEAERAADLAALAYQRGEAHADAFHAEVTRWESLWAEAQSEGRAQR